MTFQDIQAFLDVVKYGTVMRAADARYISHSTLSWRISKLEQEVGAELFVRRKVYVVRWIESEGEVGVRHRLHSLLYLFYIVKQFFSALLGRRLLLQLHAVVCDAFHRKQN